VRTFLLHRAWSRIWKFVRLSSSEQLFLVRTLAWLVYVRVLLRVLPFRLLQQHFAKLSRNVRVSVDGRSIKLELIPWAVRAASKYVPGARCLAQALTAQVLYARRGYPTVLRIGVFIGENGARFAHAWIEKEGKPVVKDLGAISQYIPIDISDLSGTGHRQWRLFS
jgi:hypothetical protein